MDSVARLCVMNLYLPEEIGADLKLMEWRSRMRESSRVHLVCSVGLGNYEPTAYQLATASATRSATSRFAPAALARLLDLRGARASVLVTPAARARWYEQMAAELRVAGLEVQPVHVSEVRAEEEVLQAFQRLVEAVQPGETVILDVTYSLRHLPFVYFAALIFLTALRGVKLDGIYYGARELPSQDGMAPIVNVTPLFRLVQWYHAVQTARDSGDLRAVAKALAQDVGELFRRGAGDVDLSRAKDAAGRLAQDLAARLPLETGLRAAALQRALERLVGTGPAFSPSHLALGELQTLVTSLAVSSGISTKDQIVLDKAELDRQLRLAEWYAGQRDIPGALLILREWIVNLVLWRWGSGDAQWLERRTRQKSELYLGALSYRAQHQLATEGEKDLASLWDSVANSRNAYAHAGMRPKEVGTSFGTLQALIQGCRGLLENTTSPQRLPERGGGRLLVTPLGLTPGVVYTAILRVRPDRVIVVTSEEAARALPVALERVQVQAQAKVVPYLVREVQEPFVGYREAARVLDDEARAWLAEAEEVVVNLAGGTTVMQYIVEHLAREAERLGIPVQRGATVDRRPPQEQRDEPYVLGEWVELSAPDGNSGTEEVPDANV